MEILVGNLTSKLVTDNPKILEVFHKNYSYKVPGYQYTPQYKRRVWDGNKSYFKLDGTFRTGLMERVMEDLYKLGVNKEIRSGDPLLVDPLGYTILDVNNYEYRDYQKEAIDYALSEKRCIFKSPTGCHKAGTKVLMFDGTWKTVENIKVGDEVMGPDSSKRTVKLLHQGIDKMYKISPIRGESFIVNKDHILSLVKTNEHKNEPTKYLNISVKDYLELSKNKKHLYKLYRPNIIEFRSKDNLPIDPYFLGILLGDGSLNHQIGVTNIDPEITSYIYDIANAMNLSVRKSGITYYFKKKIGKLNPLKECLNTLKLYGIGSSTKFIPQLYKTSSIENRLKLLAGIIDTDGYYSREKNEIDFISKSKTLAEDVKFIAQSLGFFVAYEEKYCVCGNSKTKAGGIYYRLRIYGNNLHKIPTKIERKKARIGINSKDNLRTGFEVTELNNDNYFGFELDGDKLYIIDDFFVTHNSGKTLIMAGIIKSIRSYMKNCKVVVLFKEKGILKQTYDFFKSCGLDNLGINSGEGYIYGDVMLSTVQSIHKILDTHLDSAEVLMVDEVHQFGKGEVTVEAIQAFPNAIFRYGFTATIPELKSDPHLRLVLEGAFGPVYETRTMEDLIKDGMIAKPIIQIIEYAPKLDDSDHDLSYQEIYEKFIVNSSDRNKLITTICSSIDSNNKNHKTLILCKNLEHVRTLSDLIPNSFTVEGKDSLEDRYKIINKFLKSKSGYLIGTNVMQTGISINEISHMVNSRGLEGEIPTIQGLGRGVRKADGKDVLYFYDFMDKVPYLEDHSKKRLKHYKNLKFEITHVKL